MEIHFLGIQGYRKGQAHKNGSKLNYDARFGIFGEFPLKIWSSYQKWSS